MRVMKFGGTSLSDGDMFVRVANVVKNTGGEKIVILSAVKGVTDIISEHVLDFRALDVASERADTIKKKHMEILDRIFLILGHEKNNEVYSDSVEKINMLHNKYERLLYGVAYIDEMSPASRDILLSMGERFSTVLMEAALRLIGLKASAVESDTIGLVTDGVFGKATAIIEECEFNLRETIIPMLENGTVPVITGFFGSDSEGRTTIFGRNGSDYGAAVVARSVKADRLEIWKTVDGFMTGNPDIIEDSRIIDNLSYEEAAELAYFGARVLHPRCVEPISRMNIPIYVKNVFKPEERGTIISGESPTINNIIKSVALMNGLSMLRIYGAGAGYTSGLFAKIFGVLGERDISVYSSATTQTSFTIVIDEKKESEAIAALNMIREKIFVEITPFNDKSLICVVGRGMRTARGLVARLFSSVASAGVNIETISAGASKVAFNFIVSRKDADAALKAVHSEFFNDF